MSGSDSQTTPKKLRQLSIAESFGLLFGKRKISPESSFCSNKPSKRMSHLVPDDAIDLGKQADDGSPDNATNVAILTDHTQRDIDCLASGISGVSRKDSEISASRKARDTSFNLPQNGRKNDNECADGAGDLSQGFSQSSQDLFDMLMTEKREANDRLLKREIKDDFDLSQCTPSPKGIAEPKQKTFTSKPAEDLLMIYESPDMFDTFPTPEFDDIETEEEDVPLPWMGMPKSRLKTAPDCLHPLPQLKASKNHTVLFDTSYFDFGPPPASKENYVDAWDSDHVKLPCSPKNLFPVTQGQERTLINRWELIENSLLSDIKTSHQLERAIKGYNVRFNQPFSALHTLLNETFESTERTEFFSKTLPGMIKLALSLRIIITQPVPLIKRQQGHCLTLSQQQIACLLCNAFFCTFPRRNATSTTSEYKSYPIINFNRLLVGPFAEERKAAHVEKLKTILHYFKRVTSEMPSGAVTFERRVCRDFPLWNKTPSELGGLHIRQNGLIEDEGKGMLQMDFANKYIGGGTLGSGLVQEEILFSICPELLASCLFTEVLDDNECVYITGVERFSKYSGYSNEYKWEGDYEDSNTRDAWRRKTSYFVALDATQFRKFDEQFKVGNIRRELNKLYCGFQGALDPDYSPAIATGNWGCGAFGGDLLLKALLQMMAAAVVCRDLCYMTHRDEKLMKTVHDMHQFVTSSKLTVGKLWNLICQYNNEEVLAASTQKRPIVENIFEFMQRIHRSYDTSTDEEDNFQMQS